MDKTGKEILDLIEKVDPADMKALDEIDARVWCCIHHGGYGGRDADSFLFMPVADAPAFRKGFERKTQYTRSRDALKAIRPEGWFYEAYQTKDGGASWRLSKRDGKTGMMPASGFKTEELAELHAIIQAISHERAISGEGNAE